MSFFCWKIEGWLGLYELGRILRPSLKYTAKTYCSRHNVRPRILSYLRYIYYGICWAYYAIFQIKVLGVILLRSKQEITRITQI